MLSKRMQFQSYREAARRWEQQKVVRGAYDSGKHQFEGQDAE